jgi:hypothetical protein
MEMGKSYNCLYNMAAMQWLEMIQKAEKKCIIQDGKYNTIYEVKEASFLRT